MVELEKAFIKVYNKFKLHFYQKMFEKLDDNDQALTTVETFCMETIYVMNKPTVNEFAKFLGISTPNAAYKVTSLVKKGYVKKVRSESDKREYHLVPTDKYIEYYDISNTYTSEIMKRVKKRFSDDEISQFINILKIVSEELMREVNI